MAGLLLPGETHTQAQPWPLAWGVGSAPAVKGSRIDRSTAHLPYTHAYDPDPLLCALPVPRPAPSS